ncbi:MAG: HNH endonuclease [Niastella sp.]|nr:HNH endonuclease [Niastella sp.]
MEKGNKLWTREEFILALNLYLKLPFGKMHSRTPEIIHLANLIGRTPDSVAIRLTNFASVDSFHQARGVKGMEGGKKQVQPIWDEFINDREELLFESEKILAEKEHTKIEERYANILEGIGDMKGEDKIRAVKTRVNQDLFRKIVITNYGGQCAITGIDIPDLLLASHIIPWSKNEQQRLNPENGICFSPLYDRAYDKGYIGINENFEVIVSSSIKEKHSLEYHAKHFASLTGSKITLPQKYYPKREFLQFHMDTIFRG